MRLSECSIIFLQVFQDENILCIFVVKKGVVQSLPLYLIQIIFLFLKKRNNVSAIFLEKCSISIYFAYLNSFFYGDYVTRRLHW